MEQNTQKHNTHLEHAFKVNALKWHPEIVVFKAPPVSTGYWTIDDWANYIDWTIPVNAAALADERFRAGAQGRMEI